jgi:hypothetical protein
MPETSTGALRPGAAKGLFRETFLRNARKPVLRVEEFRMLISRMSGNDLGSICQNRELFSHTQRVIAETPELAHVRDILLSDSDLSDSWILSLRHGFCRLLSHRVPASNSVEAPAGDERSTDYATHS